MYIKPLAIMISFIAFTTSVNVNNGITVGNRETNLVAMVAVKANNVSLYMIVNALALIVY
jgi:hypothetical protein